MRAQLKWVVGLNAFEICVTKADGTHLVQLTDSALFDGTRVWSAWAETHIPELGGRQQPRACGVRDRCRLRARRSDVSLRRSDAPAVTSRR